jgi:lipase maturation factor 1
MAIPMIDELKAAANWLLGPEDAAKKSPFGGNALITGMLTSRENPSLAESFVSRPTHLWPRWLFLRALGLIYLSAFYSLIFQIKGLIGPNGILPAGDYLEAVAAAMHGYRFWFTPTLFWFGSSDRAMMLVIWAGFLASLFLIFNLWPRAALAVCFVCFLSFVTSAQDFAGYQSDGMLLEAGFLALFFAPPGLRPGLARGHAPSRASLFLLQWEWFCIYFESGVVKIASGDQSWRHLTALDDYYQNGPLPTWLGWYAQKLPHEVHAATVLLTFAVEIFIVWMLFLPRRFRIVCFCIVTPFQLGIALTANYTFINYLLLSLGFLLLDDCVIEAILPRRIRNFIDPRAPGSSLGTPISRSAGAAAPPAEGLPVPSVYPPAAPHTRGQQWVRTSEMALAAFFLGLIFYVTGSRLVLMLVPGLPFPEAPARWVSSFRVADSYGLFATMTHARYEIEFQGSMDGKTWTAYPFRHKPQDVNRAPGIYAPYQPRFDWNLWFASLGTYQNYHFVIWTEERLLDNEPDVLTLFAGNPFAGAPPQRVRSVIYQYWFTDLKTKRDTGAWWRREMLGEYAPWLQREPDGRISIHDIPPVLGQQAFQ